MAIKIMYLLDDYDVPQGGTEGQVLQLIQHLDRSRYEPHMTLLRHSEYIENNEFPCPVKVLGIRKLFSPRTILKIIGFAYDLRRDGYRIVHCFFNDVSLIAPPILRRFGIRTLVSRRDLGFWYTPMTLRLLRLVVPFVDRYIANSLAVKRTVMTQERIPEKKLTVIYNGYVTKDMEQATTDAPTLPSGIPSEGPLVGIVANLRPIKRIDTLIQAFARIAHHHPEAGLVIVGGDDISDDGVSMLSKLKSLSQRLGIAEKVFFTGRVVDTTPYIERFTVAALVSESEGFSNSIIEYMQAARPIVCTNTGGNPELIREGHNGYLVPVGDVNRLAERIGQLLSNPNLAQALGNASRKAVLTTCTCERMLNEQMACYDELLSVDYSSDTARLRERTK